MQRKFRLYDPSYYTDDNGEVRLQFTIEQNPETEYIEVIAEGIGDEYHTMHELYQHRMALNIFLFKMMFKLDEQVRGKKEANEEPLIMKSKLHNDGTMFEGYFIVFANTSQGQISYHYDLKHWDKFKIPEVERIPVPFDGHGSLEVIERLMKL